MIKLEYRDVEADFSAIVNDSLDEDHDPDRTPMTGTVEFIPVYQQPGVIVHNELIRPQTIDATIHDGKLLVSRMSPEDPDVLTYQPLRLPVTVGDHLNQDWHYRVRFSGVRVEGEEQAIPDVLLPVEPGDGPVQLWVDAAEKVGSAIRQRGPAGPGIASIESDGGQVTMTLENGKSTSFTIPTVKGDQGPPGELPGVESGRITHQYMTATWHKFGPVVVLQGTLKRASGAIGSYWVDGLPPVDYECTFVAKNASDSTAKWVAIRGAGEVIPDPGSTGPFSVAYMTKS